MLNKINLIIIESINYNILSTRFSFELQIHHTNTIYLYKI
jgi:hypothetical protein